MEDPTQYLVRPEDPDSALTKGFVNPLDIFNYVSPSAWLNAAIAEVTGFDAIGWMRQALTGFQQWYSELSPAERDLVVTEARRELGTD